MTSDVRTRLLALDAEGALDLPRPGAGRTAERHRRLAALTRRETVSIGRLAEAHTDAVAILAEAGLDPVPGALYGVWASEHGPRDPARLDPGDATVTGVKRFCSGLGVVDRALVAVAHSTGSPQLVELAFADGPTMAMTTGPWATAALAPTATGDVALCGHAVARTVGPPGWYTARTGFWDGALGPAACWAGGAIGLVDAATAAVGDDRARRVELGAMVAAAWAMLAVLDAVGHDIDAGPATDDHRRLRALAARHTIERHVAAIVDRFGWAAGPRPLCFDPLVAQRMADVALYVRQHGGTRDLDALAADATTLLGDAR